MSYVEYDPYARPREPIKRWTRMDEANLRAKQKEYDQLVNYVAPGERLHVPQLERDIRYYRKAKKKTTKKSKNKKQKSKITSRKIAISVEENYNRKIKSKKYPQCVGRKIKSKGKGRGLGTGRGKGPIGRRKIKNKKKK